MEYTEAFSLLGLLIPLCIILSAPAFDFILKSLTHPPVPELATLIGVGTSLLLAGWGIPRERWRAMVMGARPWRYALIVIGMFTYLAVFNRSGAPELIAGLALPPVALGVGVGALLGLATGRIQAPAAIVLPIYMAQTGSISPWGFAVIYFAVYLGYILSPVHPCVSVSVEYASTSLGHTLRALLAPTLLGLIATALAGWWFL